MLPIVKEAVGKTQRVTARKEFRLCLSGSARGPACLVAEGVEIGHSEARTE